MNELQKILTLDEIVNEMNRLRLQAINLSEKLNIGFFELRPVTWKDVMVKSSHKGDVMLMNIIKTDETRETYDSLVQSYEEYKQLLCDRLAQMMETKSKEECIVFVRDKLHWKWDNIAKLFSYSKRQCIRIYKQNSKMSQDVTQCH